MLRIEEFFGANCYCSHAIVLLTATSAFWIKKRY